MTKETRERCEAVAKEHGAKLTWVKGKGFGYYIPNTNKIFVARRGSDRTVLSVFCHELSHYNNFKTHKYYKYHTYTGKQYTRRFKTKHGAVRYALDAELYTDKMGRRLCKKLFPHIKFKSAYRDNKQWYNYMYSKFFGGYFIIVLKKSLTSSKKYANLKYKESRKVLWN